MDTTLFPMNIKVCSKCKEEKELGEFTLDRGTRDGYACACKQCSHLRHTQYQQNNKERPIGSYEIPVTKICSRCHTEKDIDEFSRARGQRDGYAFQCKQCDKDYKDKYKFENGKYLLSGEYKIPSIKICSRCHEEKTIDEFHRDNGSRDGYCSRCKQCYRDYADNNKEHLREYQARWVKSRKSRHPSDYKIVERKICSQCLIEKEISEFPKDQVSEDGYGSDCKPCKKIRTRNKEYYRKYGITIDEYNEMLGRQSGLCAICRKKETVHLFGKPIALCIDHNHITNMVRELLCQRCNHMISCETPDLLRTGADYLEKWNK